MPSKPATADRSAPRFRPHGPDAAGIVTWVHIGDLHMRRDGEENHRDLRAIVAELERCFSDSVSFAFLPGDIADDGSRSAYAVVRRTLDALSIPWCAIVGDHDVHERSLSNFEHMMSRDANYAFTVGRARFIAVNAFGIPRPESFALLPEQLAWVENELRAATDAGLDKILFLHCYPSELRTGRVELAALMSQYRVRMVDMGHTHYNEVANDGATVYAATRSTGQREEGALGFSIANLDDDATSWRFIELGALPAVVITSPADWRLRPDDRAPRRTHELTVRAKVWAASSIAQVRARIAGRDVPLQRIAGSAVWQGTVDTAALGHEAPAELRVIATDVNDAVGEDAIDIVLEPAATRPRRRPRDLDNALIWPGHGALGTRLGPNKNGRKW